jgi:hypothetical protein
MSSILDGIAGQLGGDTIARLGEQIGADPATTANAIQIALPMIVGALANNASTPAGAGALDTALARDHDGSVLDDLGSLLGGATGAGGGGALDGAAILGHILGGRQDAVQDGIGRTTGLGRGQVVQLLMMLAPLVMAYLGRQKRDQGLDADGVGAALRNERDHIETRQPGLGGLLNQFFDRDHDGSLVDDIARMAPGVLGGLFGGK